MTEIIEDTDNMIAPDWGATGRDTAAHRKMGPRSEIGKHT